MNWQAFAELHPDVPAETDADGNGHHAVIGHAHIFVGDGPSMILAAFHDLLAETGTPPPKKDSSGPLLPTPG